MQSKCPWGYAMYYLVLYDNIPKNPKEKKTFLTLPLTKETTRQICAHCNHPVYGRLRLQLPGQSPSQVRRGQRKSACGACGTKKIYFQFLMVLSLCPISQLVPNKSFSCNARKETFFREVIPKSAYMWTNFDTTHYILHSHFCFLLLSLFFEQM